MRMIEGHVRRQPTNTAFCYTRKHGMDRARSHGTTSTLEAALSFFPFETFFNVLCGGFVHAEDFLRKA